MDTSERGEAGRAGPTVVASVGWQGGLNKLKLGRRERTGGKESSKRTPHGPRRAASRPPPGGQARAPADKKRPRHPRRHWPRTCPISSAPGCWTPRWPLPPGCGHGGGCSSGCRPPPPRRARPGRGRPRSPPLAEAGRAGPLCRRACGGRGARRSDRARRWHSWRPGGCARPAGERREMP